MWRDEIYSLMTIYGIHFNVDTTIKDIVLSPDHQTLWIIMLQAIPHHSRVTVCDYTPGLVTSVDGCYDSRGVGTFDSLCYPYV